MPGRYVPVTHVQRRPKRSEDVGVHSTEQSAGIIVGGFCPQHHVIRYRKVFEAFLLTERLVKLYIVAKGLPG